MRHEEVYRGGKQVGNGPGIARVAAEFAAHARRYHLDGYKRPSRNSFLAKLEELDVGETLSVRVIVGKFDDRGFDRALMRAGVDDREAERVCARYRADFLFGEIYHGSGFGAPEPIVRYANCTKQDREWQLTGDEIRHVTTIAKASGLDFFAVDFIRRRSDGRPVFTDINSFPVLKEIPSERRLYGYRHDFDRLRPLSGSTRSALSVWEWVDEVVAEAVQRRERLGASQPGGG